MNFKQSFQIQYDYQVKFTKNLFSFDNESLSQILLDEAKVVVFFG